MLKVGLTGNFFSGFTDVSDYLETMNVPVFDADLILKFMLNFSPRTKQKIQNELGRNIYENNRLDLKKIQTNKEFERVLDVVQMDLLKSYEKWRNSQLYHPYTVFKSSILFEKKFDKFMNLNINVFRPITYRKGDISTLTNIPTVQISHILNNEMDELEKNSNSDFIIHNYMNSIYGEKSVSFREQIHKIDRAILNKCPNLESGHSF